MSSIFIDASTPPMAIARATDRYTPSIRCVPRRRRDRRGASARENARSFQRKTAAKKPKKTLQKRDIRRTFRVARARWRRVARARRTAMILPWRNSRINRGRTSGRRVLMNSLRVGTRGVVGCMMKRLRGTSTGRASLTTPPSISSVTVAATPISGADRTRATSNGD